MASTYKTKAGDTWDVIAKRALGDERYMYLMLDENPEHNYTSWFDGGVVLTVPDLPDPPLSSSLPPWRR